MVIKGTSDEILAAIQIMIQIQEVLMIDKNEILQRVSDPIDSLVGSLCF